MGLDQLELASFALVLVLCPLHVQTRVSRTLRLLIRLCTGQREPAIDDGEEEQEEETQLLPETPHGVGRVSLPASFSRSDEVHMNQIYHQLYEGNSNVFT